MSVPVGIPEDDPIRAVWAWRADSQTLSRIRPVMERLQMIPDQPCVMGLVPYACLTENQMCIPCALRDIRAALFGEQPTEGGTS